MNGILYVFRRVTIKSETNTMPKSRVADNSGFRGTENSTATYYARPPKPVPIYLPDVFGLQ